MIRPLTVILLFGLCLLVVLAALVWTSVNLLRLDSAEREAQSQAALEESVRLALWRMDSALAGLVVQESVRPAAEYQLDTAPANPSGMGLAATPHVLAHLQVAPDGRITSPQSPDLAENLQDQPAGGLGQQLIELAAVARATKLADRLPQQSGAPFGAGSLLPAGPAPEPPAVSMSQQARGAQEFQQRARYVQSNNVWAQNATQADVQAAASSHSAGGVMTPVWLEGRLLLARRARVGRQDCLQICWLDWPSMESWLSGIVRDLLPDARLAPAPSALDKQPTRRLAALPAVLIPGQLPAASASGPSSHSWSSLRWSLAVAWICVLLAALAVAVLLTGVVSLSERRAAFVSAVTHELRTPLTTFRMYAEMLAEDMLPNETDRRTYLNTLRSEAERLAHLVENVLAYARVERGRGVSRREMVTVAGLIERMRERLSSRCQQAEMQLIISLDADAGGREVLTDIASVEQIVFNLVDNACKYAASAADRRIHLAASVAGQAVHVSVADHGPGLSVGVARSLFHPFSKSAEDAARSAPGIGLGLALSRRLARQVGGRLQLTHDGDYGARFVLSLPVC